MPSSKKAGAAKKASAPKPQTRKRTRARAPKPRAVSRIVIEEVEDEAFAGRYLGAFIARKGRVKSDVRSTPEKAEADLREKLAEAKA
jgi:hypothetical protein